MDNAATQPGTSLQQFLTSLVVSFSIFVGTTLVFVLLRKRILRIYEPKSHVAHIPARRQTRPLPGGPFSWVSPLAMETDLALLAKAGLDGYFFLRYLKFMVVITLGGCVMLWPILLPVYGTGKAGSKGMDKVSISNIAGDEGRYYAPVLLSWFFVAFVCFGIFREHRHYLQVRQEYLTSPGHAESMQACTVLVTQIPAAFRSKTALSSAFSGYPGGIRHITMNRNLDKLEELVEERSKAALKLEAAQIKLIKTAIKKQGMDNKHDGNEAGEGAAGQHVPVGKRPSHKLGFLGVLGKKVDTIDWCESELQRLNNEIEHGKANMDEQPMMNSAFLTFHNQTAAQMALQTITHRDPYAMHPRYTEIAPHDVVWNNMSLTWQQRLVKSSIVTAFIAALILLWSVPVAFVGTLSNIDYLTDKVPFLRFINNCPEVLKGLITAYLPIVLLAVLMALLPVIMRFCAKTAGVPTRSLIEFSVAQYYFVFLVVQSFLVVTVVSASVASVTAIIDNPSSAPSLLAESLPKASNFYIAYILLQGLAISAGELAQIVSLALYFILGKLLDKTPRKQFNRYTTLRNVGFGTLFPVYTFLAFLSLVFSVIAPILLFFAALAFGLFYLVYKYQFLFVYQLDVSTMGRLYPRALQQTLVGLYFMEVCMIGLTAVGKSYGAIALSIIILVATAIFHITLNNAFGPLLDAVPTMLIGSHTKEKGAAMEGVEGTLTASNTNHSEEKTGDRASLTGHRSENVFDEKAYQHPALQARQPGIWLPRDGLGVSADLTRKTREGAGIESSDAGASIDNKGRVTWDGKTNPPDYDASQRDYEL
ncbi:hypothetical protein BCR37DRAFT_38898 [Protomyces lactucae-debilis]|uniref:DUF221-domain-containing protein n=1 Tax=Protomyces lactucae-debilis TaxID=2754530 RepID=A0A1Y2FEU0_PROLT|nr:uncharacterized protein BCR37DRAFT_38898 [Protomyces lactucae-debilis]ORY82127.1 hypothetical protein BCR37DRAFT_38898 [Protomyces lactucae-debilis]